MKILRLTAHPFLSIRKSTQLHNWENNDGCDILSILTLRGRRFHSKEEAAALHFKTNHGSGQWLDNYHILSYLHFRIEICNSKCFVICILNLVRHEVHLAGYNVFVCVLLLGLFCDVASMTQTGAVSQKNHLARLRALSSLKLTLFLNVLLS